MKKKFAVVIFLLAVSLFSGCNSSDKVIVQNIAGVINDDIPIIENTESAEPENEEDIIDIIDAEDLMDDTWQEENDSQPVSLSDSEAKERVKILLEGTMYFNSVILNGGLAADTSVSYMDDNGNHYSPVVHDYFFTLDDLKHFIFHYITEDYYNSYRSGLSVDDLIFAGSAPLYTEFDECLCINTARMGSGIPYKWDYTTSRVYENRERFVELNMKGTAGGESYECTVDITLENGAWKVNGVMIS